MKRYLLQWKGNTIEYYTIKSESKLNSKIGVDWFIRMDKEKYIRFMKELAENLHPNIDLSKKSIDNISTKLLPSIYSNMVALK